MEVADVPEHHVEGVKPCKKRKRTEEDDRISNLPDAIIHHILSFLSIVDVVRTSVFARRWKDLWIEAPSLIVDDLQVDTEDKFVNIFNSVQKMYKSMNIERHSLSIQQPFNRKAVEAWVHFAVQRNVEKLRVNAFPKKPFEVSCCRYLKVLELDLHDGSVVLPVTGCFLSLEIFSLSRAQFTGDAILDVMSSQYPRLRRLNLDACLGLNYINITCPTLQVFKIIRCLDLNQLDVSARRLQMLYVRTSFTSINKTKSVTISSPSLQIFEWRDYVFDNFHIGSFTSLKEAHICLLFHFYPELDNYYDRTAMKFLSQLLCAKSLRIGLPCFWMIKRNFSHSFFFNKRDLMDYKMAPLNHLLEVRILGFRGMESEIEFVRILLEFAVILKRIIITLSDEIFVNQEMKSDIMQKLAEFKMISPDAVMYLN